MYKEDHNTVKNCTLVAEPSISWQFTQVSLRQHYCHNRITNWMKKSLT